MDSNFEGLFAEGHIKSRNFSRPAETIQILIAEDDDSFREM